MPDRRQSTFLQQQYELVKRQCDLIARGDYVSAIVMGKSLDYRFVGMAGVSDDLLDDNGTDPAGRNTRDLISKMKRLQSQALDFLKNERKRLTRALLDVKRGRQLLQGYRSGKERNRRFFDIKG